MKTEIVGARFSGRERYCCKCEFKGSHLLCPHVEACYAAYIRGFVKGVKYQKQKAKEERI